MGGISFRKILRRFPEIQFLREMENGLEKIGEMLMLQKYRIFQKTNKKGMFLFKKITELLQSFHVDDNVVLERSGPGLCFTEFFFVPVPVDQQIAFQLAGPHHKFIEAPQKFQSYLAEKGADDHIQLLEQDFFCRIPFFSSRYAGG